MASMVQVAVAGDLTEAEEIQTILSSAGIPWELQPAVEQHPAASMTRRRGCSSRRPSSRPRRTRSRRMTDPDELIGGR